MATGRDVAELAEVADAAGELLARLAALPANQRLAVVLRHVADLPVPEIAAVMACPEGTARSHVARGLAALRAAYGTDRTRHAKPAAPRGTGAGPMNPLPAVPIEDQLAQLAVRPPRGFADRVVARVTTVAGPTGPLHVAWTASGICAVEFAARLDAAAFAAQVRERFGRPVLPADRPLPGLVAALRTGSARRLAFDLTGLTPFEVAVLEVDAFDPRRRDPPVRVGGRGDRSAPRRPRRRVGARA